MLQNIREKKALDDETKNQLTTILKEFKDRFVAQRKTGAAKV
jgi:F0F1-type ATP synthase alpha subunit